MNMKKYKITTLQQFYMVTFWSTIVFSSAMVAIMLWLK